MLPLDLSPLRRLGADRRHRGAQRPASGNDIPVTYVPARNTIFLSLCLGWAEAAGARDLFIGVNALDYSGYPDCRPDFIAASRRWPISPPRRESRATASPIHTPLIDLTKADIVREAARLGLDAGDELVLLRSDRRTCKHCGLCDSCRLRARGFAEAGLPDPTDYAVRGGGA